MNYLLAYPEESMLIVVLTLFGTFLAIAICQGSRLTERDDDMDIHFNDTGDNNA